jgi:hypothetical protein
MNLKSILFFSVIFFAVILFFVFFPKIPENNISSINTPQKIFFLVENNSLNEPVLIKGKYFYEKGINSIEFNSQKKECFNEKECEFIFQHIFLVPGTQEITLIFISENNSITLNELVKIRDSKKCINGLNYGECIESNYCNNGVIEFNCIKCPCPVNYACIENKCVLKNINLELIELKTSKIIGENNPLKIEFKLNLIESLLEETELKVNLINEKKIISSKSITLNELNSQNFLINFPLNDLTAGNYLFSLEFEFNSVPVLNSNEFNVQIISETGTPLTPLNLTAIAYNNSVDLSWENIDSTVVLFNVYKSISVQSTHISYSFTGSTDLNSFSFDSLEKGMHYFVVTAVNVFGIESDYSIPEKIEIR